jgi:hypothetical protein
MRSRLATQTALTGVRQESFFQIRREAGTTINAA